MMLELLLTFVVGFLISYIGTIPPGSMNLTVFNYCLNQQFTKAYNFSITASLVEIFYVLIAVFLQSLFENNDTMVFYFRIIASSVLLILGIGYFFKKPMPPKNISFSKRQGVLEGALISLGNPMALIFWVAVTAYLRLQNIIYLKGVLLKITFSIAASLGTMLLLFTVIFYCKKVKYKKIPFLLLNRVMGITFILLACWTFFF